MPSKWPVSSEIGQVPLGFVVHSRQMWFHLKVLSCAQQSMIHQMWFPAKWVTRFDAPVEKPVWETNAVEMDQPARLPGLNSNARGRNMRIVPCK